MIADWYKVAPAECKMGGNLLLLVVDEQFEAGSNGIRFSGSGKHIPSSGEMEKSSNDDLLPCVALRANLETFAAPLQFHEIFHASLFKPSVSCSDIHAAGFHQHFPIH